MQQCLPYGEFKEDNDINIEDILNTKDDNDIGYVILADLKYPKQIKERTKHLPLCPQNKKITEKDFENEEYMTNHKPEHYTPTRKLISDQRDKKYYLLHYRNSKFYVRMGMIIEKVH